MCEKATLVGPAVMLLITGLAGSSYRVVDLENKLEDGSTSF